MCRCIGKHGLLGVECRFLVWGDQVGSVELVDLEPQQVDLPGACPLVAAQCRQFGVDLGESTASRTQRTEIDVTELVQRCSLGRRCVLRSPDSSRLASIDLRVRRVGASR